MELKKLDMEILERMVDAYSLQAVVSALSYICGEKAEHLAVNWQDTASAKGWMVQAKHLDQLAARWERGE